jgi:hypothetical protein
VNRSRTRTIILSATALLASTLLAGTAMAQVKTYKHLPDGVGLKKSDLPGYVKASGACVDCHSAEYMAYQPPSAGRNYWQNVTLRMKNVFKVPLDDDDIALIVDYLVKTYGNEQGK